MFPVRWKTYAWVYGLWCEVNTVDIHCLVWLELLLWVVPFLVRAAVMGSSVLG